MSCSVQAKRGPLTWRRNSGGVVSRERRLFMNSQHYQVLVERANNDNNINGSLASPSSDISSTLNSNSTNDLALDDQYEPSSSSSSPGPPQDQLETYTLQIRNVTLMDEDVYRCYLGSKRDGLESRRANLTVLQPPQELELLVRQLNGPERPGSVTGLEHVLTSAVTTARQQVSVACPVEFNLSIWPARAIFHEPND